MILNELIIILRIDRCSVTFVILLFKILQYRWTVQRVQYLKLSEVKQLTLFSPQQSRRHSQNEISHNGKCPKPRLLKHLKRFYTLKIIYTEIINSITIRKQLIPTMRFHFILTQLNTFIASITWNYLGLVHWQWNNCVYRTHKVHTKCT